MPIHAWESVPTGFFHHFHQRWSGAICDRLNDGRLPTGYFALVEQHAIGVVPDVLTLQKTVRPSPGPQRGRGVAVAEIAPHARIISRASESEIYAAKASHVAIRNMDGEVVSVLEIVSPGDKHSRLAVRQFVEKSLDLLRHGINLLVVDLFPPSSRDPQGFHQLIWDQIDDGGFQLPPDKDLTLVSYCAGTPLTAFIEPVAVGDYLPEMPVFLDAETYVPLPLEETYASTWERCPDEYRQVIAAAQ